MKKSFLKTRAAIAIGLILIVMISGACSRDTGRGNRPFQIVFSASQINQNAVTNFGASLLNSMPELTVEGRAPLFTPMAMGTASPGADPMMAMGMTMRLTAQISGGEIDIIISSLENAASMAQGGSFMPLAEVLTEQEISSLGDRLISFDIIQVEGMDAVPTGERTPEVGVNITGKEEIRSIFGSQEIAVFIIANTGNIELSKAVLRSFI